MDFLYKFTGKIKLGENMFLAIKEMIKDKGRFFLVIAIIILISYLVFFLIGLAYGLAMDNRTVVDNFDADFIVLKEGNNSNIYTSILDESALDDFKEYDPSPVNINRSVAYIDGVENEEDPLSIVFVGLKEDSASIPKLIEGKKPKSENEVLASISLKKEEGISLNQSLKISSDNKKFRIVGFVENSKFNVSPAIYTGLYESVSSIMEFSGRPQMLESGERPKRFSAILLKSDQDILGAKEGYDILTIGEFINELPGYIPQVLTFSIMIIFLVLISSIVLGVFMYIITIQKKETFGIMKVQGIASSYISKSVVLQTLLVNVIGLFIGLGLTLITGLIIPAAVPFRASFVLYAATTVIFLLMSLLGVIFSVRGVSNVDPLEVLN